MFKGSISALLCLTLLFLPSVLLAERDPSNVSKFAGSGEWGSADGERDEAEFRLPTYMTMDAQGMIYIADTENHLIRQIDSAGNVTTLAGQIVEYDEHSQPVGGDKDGTLTDAQFDEPRGLAVDVDGILYVADSMNGSIRKVDFSAGQVTTLVSSLDFPSDLVFTEDGALYVTETLQHRLLKISLDGQVTVVAGGGYEENAGMMVGAYHDGTTGVAQFNEPTGLALAEDGTLYIADTGNQRIRSLSLDGYVSTLAGSGIDVVAETGYYMGGFQDGMGETARFHYPHGMDLAIDGSLYVADTYNHRIRSITPAGEVRTVAGLEKHGRELGSETRASFNHPTDVLIFPDSNLLIVDQWNQRLQLVEWYQLPDNVPLDEGIHLVLNDQFISMETPPENQAGRVMVPVRALAEVLDYEVEWIRATGTVVLTDGDLEMEIHLQIGQPVIHGSQGQAWTTDVAPYMKDNRSMIPIRIVAETFQKQVNWLADSQTVLIRD